MDFPALGWPAHLQDEHFMLLDESLLPEEETYIRIQNAAEAADAIHAMRTRAFGQLLTVFYALILTARTADDVQGELAGAAELLENSRPTFGFSTYTAMVLEWAAEAIEAGDAQPGQTVEDRILAFLDHIRDLRIQRAGLTAGLLKDGDTVLTHCNVSGELVLAARICREQGKAIRFIATETRPYFQGRLTAWELAAEDFEVMLIPDNRAAGIMAEGACSCIITGADRAARNGDIVNKTGTRQLAECARYYGIPFYVLIQDPGSTATGRDVTIEYRSAEEMLTFKNKSVYPPDTDAWYPAFDMTSADLITRLITFSGVFEPGEWGSGEERLERRG